MSVAAAPKRFLTKWMALFLVLYGLFALTFARFQVQGDAVIYFNMMRRFFGERTDSALAYQFGSDVWNTPFYLVGRLLAVVFGLQPHAFHVSFEEIMIWVAGQCAFAVTLYLAWRILRELQLPATAAVLFFAAFGSPLFYYAAFEPAMKHVTDTLYITAAVFLLYRLFANGRDREAIFLGALAGVAANTRYVDIAFFAGIALILAVGRYSRPLVLATGTMAVIGLLLFALPWMRGITYFEPSYYPPSAIGRIAAGAHPFVVASTRNPFNGFDPLIPFKMLGSDHRGLFVWTPLTALAVVGYVLRLRMEHDLVRRRFLWALLVGSAALVAGHVFWAEWDGAYSFSSRFLTALFPLVVIGTAELVRRFRLRIVPVFVVCIAWSLMLAFVHMVGYDGITARDSASDMASHFFSDPNAFKVKVDNAAKRRWHYGIVLLVHDRDFQHLEAS